MFEPSFPRPFPYCTSYLTIPSRTPLIPYNNNCTVQSSSTNTTHLVFLSCWLSSKQVGQEGSNNKDIIYMVFTNHVTARCCYCFLIPFYILTRGTSDRLDMWWFWDKTNFVTPNLRLRFKLYTLLPMKIFLSLMSNTYSYTLTLEWVVIHF